MESCISSDFGTDWYLVAKGRKHSGHWRCACVNLGANVDKMELSSGKKRWSLRSQAIIATNGKYKALICAAFASCVEKNVSLLNAGTKENSPGMQRCSAEKCRSKAKPWRLDLAKQHHDTFFRYDNSTLNGWKFPPPKRPKAFILRASSAASHLCDCVIARGKSLSKKSGCGQKLIRLLPILQPDWSFSLLFGTMFIMPCFSTSFLLLEISFHPNPSSKSFDLEWHLTTPSLFSMALMLTRIANHVMVVHAPWHSTKENKPQHGRKTIGIQSNKKARPFGTLYMVPW